MGLIDIIVKLKTILPTTALVLGGIWFLNMGYSTDNFGMITTGYVLIGLGFLLQFYYIKKRYD
jgi:hypothetical protein